MRLRNKCIQAAVPRIAAATANSIQHNTPPENVLVLYDVAKA